MSSYTCLPFNLYYICTCLGQKYNFLQVYTRYRQEPQNQIILTLLTFHSRIISAHTPSNNLQQTLSCKKNGWWWFTYHYFHLSLESNIRFIRLYKQNDKLHGLLFLNTHTKSCCLTQNPTHLGSFHVNCHYNIGRLWWESKAAI